MKTRSAHARTYRKLLAASIALASMTWFASALAQAPDSTATPPASTTPPAEATPAPATPSAEATPATGATPAAPSAAATEPAKNDIAARVAALKESLMKDKGALSHYEWVETTTVLKDGVEKSKKQNRCYRGADGKPVKEPIGEQPEAKKKGGLRGKVAENKKEDIAAYLEASKKALQQYIPPSPGRVQLAKDEGRISVDMLEADKRVRLNIKGYIVPGDLLGLEVNPSTNKLLGIQVTTTVEGGKEPVTLQAAMGALEDGTSYPMKTTLDMKEKGITIIVENSGYKKVAAK